MEQWKEIFDHPQYWVSSYGRVWSEKTKKFLKPCQTSNIDKHLKIKLTENNISKKYFIHRLVMMAFAPIEEPNSFQVNHIDGNPHNNRLENLEWVTEIQNKKHYKESVIPQKRESGEFNLGAKPKTIKVELQNGHINYYQGLEEACMHMNISKSTFIRWKEHGTPVKISYIDQLPNSFQNEQIDVQKKSVPRAVQIKYRDHIEEYANGREADRALGLKEGTINLWAKRNTNKQTPTMRKLGILRVSFVKV